MARRDPYQNFNFLVEIEGIIHAGFAECSGLGSSLEVVEYREGGDPSNVRKLPGRASYTDIVLKQGISDDRQLYDWHAAALSGNVDRRDGSVILKDEAGEEKVRWNFSNAWLSKWEGPDLNAKGNEVAISTLTISCERVSRAQ